MSKGTGTMRGQRKPRKIDIIVEQSRIIKELHEVVTEQNLIIKELMKK